MANRDNPLNSEDLEQINTALKACDENKALIARAKAAGIDVSEQEAEQKSCADKLRKIKSSFFPNG